MIYGFTITIALFTSGSLLYYNEKANISVLKPEQSIFSGTLSCYPAEKGNINTFTLKLYNKINIDGEEPAGGSLLINAGRSLSLKTLLPGDFLIVRCRPEEITNRGNPEEFDYKFYLETQHIRYSAFINDQDIIDHVTPGRRKLVYRALIMREKIIEMYRQRGINGERLALVAALILGDKNLLDREQKQNFINAGVMHIMAVSGLHVAILSLFIFNLLFFLKGKFNILRVLLTIIILWSFAFVTGLTPSVLRATLMISFLHAGNLMKRNVNGINSVLASAFILILLKPSVIFEAGFLLSYSAVIYIIMFYKIIYDRLVIKNWLADKIWQSAVVTVVAQAGTFALTIMLFNQFPTYFLLTNTVIVPLSSFLIVTGALVPLTYPVEFLSGFLASILNHLTGLTEFLTEKAASLPISTIGNVGMTTVQCILMTLTIFSLSCYSLIKQSFSVIIVLVIILIASLYGTLNEISIRNKNELIVYNTPGHSTIGVKSGKILHLYSDTSVVSPVVNRHCATLGLIIKKEFNNEFNYIKAGKKNILICRSLKSYTDLKLNPEIVIITGSVSDLKYSFEKNNIPEALIFSKASVPRFLLHNRANYSDIDTIHAVKKSGAFITRLQKDVNKRGEKVEY